MLTHLRFRFADLNLMQMTSETWHQQTGGNSVHGGGGGGDDWGVQVKKIRNVNFRLCQEIMTLARQPLISIDQKIN
jgi:hypothetical protein